MNVFFYDKSFEGLLCVVFDAYTHKIFPDLLLEHGAIPPLLVTHARVVGTEAHKSERVFRALTEKLSGLALRELLYVWLSETADSDMLLLQYIRVIFDVGRSVEHNMRDSHVFAVSKLAAKVNAERHLLLGFVRFQKTTQDIYLGIIAPRYNVLSLILEHFAHRFADQKWIIYDITRHYGVFFEGGAFSSVTLDEALIEKGRLAPQLLADDEQFFQDSWKEYCKALVITERMNLRLQKRFMPVRYWEYLTEKQ